MKRFSILYAVVLTLLAGGFTACEDMLDVSSTSIQYEDPSPRQVIACIQWSVS